MTRSRSALLVAGEASGDLYGAVLVDSLRKRWPGVNLLAFGGAKMEAAGAELVHPLVDEAVIGIWEALKGLPRYYRIWRKIVSLLEETRPNPVILIDYPGFNIRVAKRASALGLDCIYYIPPKVWVWKQGRAKILAELCSLVVTIFPFEPPLYEQHGGKAVYLGHPLVDLAGDACSARLEDMVALLPGSRRQEIDLLLPRFAETALLVRKARPDTRFVLPVASTVAESRLRHELKGLGADFVETSGEPAFEVLSRARAALAASGTVTLESALASTPTVIAYAMNPLSAFFYKYFIKHEFVGLPNIVAGREICPEFLQEAARAEALSAAVLELLDDGEVRRRQLDGLAEVREKLGERGATERIVDAMAPFFEKGESP